MSGNRCFVIISVLISSLLGLYVVQAQDRAMASAPAFSGGVFVTPVPGASFSAVAVQEMNQALNDGTHFQRKTAALIARDYRGRIHNESHEVVPINFAGEPTLLSVHIYDPDTKMNTFLNPRTHVAGQRTLSTPPSTAPPSDWAQQGSVNGRQATNARLEDLGPSVLGGIVVHGYRATTTLAQKASGTEHPVMIVDEYWYSEELHINMLSKHNDPRTGEITLTVTQINRDEPPAELFEVPPGYKLVDITPTE